MKASKICLLLLGMVACGDDSGTAAVRGMERRGEPRNTRIPRGLRPRREPPRPGRRSTALGPVDQFVLAAKLGGQHGRHRFSLLERAVWIVGIRHRLGVGPLESCGLQHREQASRGIAVTVLVCNSESVQPRSRPTPPTPTASRRRPRAAAAPTSSSRPPMARSSESARCTAQPPPATTASERSSEPPLWRPPKTKRV